MIFRIGKLSSRFLLILENVFYSCAVDPLINEIKYILTSLKA